MAMVERQPGTRDYVTRVTNGGSAGGQRSTAIRPWNGSKTRCLWVAAVGRDRFGRRGCRYGVDAWDRYADALRLHESVGRLKIDGHRVRLTRSGMLVANDVMTVFI